MSFWKDKRVLASGGAGFVGSHLVEELVKDGAKVRVADNLERGKKDNLDAVINDVEFMETDLRDLDNSRKACKGMEVVFNLAAKVTGIEYNRTHQADMFENNMLLQQIPIHAASLEGVPRFMQLSTACIYPHDSKVPTPESEGDRGKPEPTNAGYGWAKRMGEKLAIWYAQETSMEVGIVRPFNAYGPRDYYDTATSHVVPALIKKVLDGMNPVEVWGSGNQKRVFVHAQDFAVGLKLLGEKYAKPDPINLGHDDMVSMKELLVKIQEVTGIRNPPFFNTDMPEGYPERAADTAKLKEATGGFVPAISLEDGIKEMVAWYRENPIPD